MTEEEIKLKEKVYKRRKHLYLIIFILVAILIIFVWNYSWNYIDKLFPNESDKQGQFGDKFGAINALFSGLAFAGVIYTILLQSLELEQQREEVRNTTKELEGQKEILDRQNFEDKFFKLLENHRRNAESVTYRRIEPKQHFTSNGKLAFLNMAEVILKHEKVKNSEERKIGEGIVKTYEEYFANTLNSIELSHYFRNFYFFVRYLDSQNSISKIDKDIYIKILRANLSNYEIFILALNGLSDRGKEFKPLIEKYKLLKNLVFEERFDKDFKSNINFIENQYTHLKASFNEQRKKLQNI